MDLDALEGGCDWQRVLPTYEAFRTVGSMVSQIHHAEFSSFRGGVAADVSFVAPRK